MDLSFEMHFNTHSAKVTKLDNGEIRCWKIKSIDHNNTKVEYQSFSNIEDASNFITTPFPSLSYHMDINQ